MSFRSMRKFSGPTALCAAIVLSLAACSDSSGPNNLDSNAALRSLSLGMSGLVDGASPAAGSLAASLGAIAPILDKVDVTVDKTTHTMFALGFRETFPDGTCEEQLFLPSLEPGICTPPSLGVLLVLWESHAENAPPDRLIVIAADEGPTNFDSFNFDAAIFPGFALYLEGQNVDNAMLSETGTLTSHVGATGPTCDIPLPPYAAAATCSIASFDEEGTISFSALTDNPTANKVATIPRQTLHGIWEKITQTKTISGLSASRALAPSLLRRPMQPGALSAPGASR
jgi:hypothetical protein